MASDNKETPPDKNSGTDAGAFASAILGGGDIADKEGAALKENLISAVDAPVEAITAGVVAADRPKEKSAAVMDEASSFFSSTPLVQETEMLPPLM